MMQAFTYGRWRIEDRPAHNPMAVTFDRETWYGHLSPGRRRRHVAAYRDDPDDVPTKPLDLPVGYPGVRP